MSDDLACCLSGKVVRNISVNKRPERPYGISNHSNIYGKSGDFKWSSVKVLADNQRLERPCWTSNRSEKQQRFLRIPWRPLLADFACNTVFPAKKSKISRPIRGNDSHTGFIIYNLKRYKTFSGSQEEQLWQVWWLGMQWFWRWSLTSVVTRHAVVLKMKLNMCSVDEIRTLGTFRSENLRRVINEGKDHEFESCIKMEIIDQYQI